MQRNDAYALKREPYVFDYVRDQLISRFGLRTVEKGGLKVYTTIDLKRQQQARSAILANEGQPGDPAAALVSIDPTNGHILAMATSSSYNETKFDYAAQAHRQTGSAFKVFALMTLIHDYHGDPNQTYYTSKELTPGWLPGYPTYHVQTVGAQLPGEHQHHQGDDGVRQHGVRPARARTSGWTRSAPPHTRWASPPPLSDFPSEVLGAVAVSPLEMADAYATLASGGVHHPPTAISRVVFSDGSVANIGDSPGNRVFTPGEAYAGTQVLKTVIQSGTGTAANYGCPAAGKTGTTSNYTDAYFDGYTPQLTTAVWVGYPNSTISMNDVNGLGPGFGGTLAAPIWHDYMQQASNGFCGDFSQPSRSVPRHRVLRQVRDNRRRRQYRQHRQHRKHRQHAARRPRRRVPARATRTTTRRCTPSRRRAGQATETARRNRPASAMVITRAAGPVSGISGRFGGLPAGGC